MDTESKVVYFGTVDRSGMDGVPHIELIRFKEPVVVKNLRVLSSNTGVHIDGAPFIGSTWPDAFRIEIFVNNLREPSSAFTQLGTLDYRARVSDQFVAAAEMLTDALAIRATYTRLSFVALGLTTSTNSNVQLSEEDVVLFRDSPFFDIERRLQDRDREVPPIGDSRVAFSAPPPPGAPFLNNVRPARSSTSNSASNDRETGEIFEDDLVGTPNWSTPTAGRLPRVPSTVTKRPDDLEDAELIADVEEAETGQGTVARSGPRAAPQTQTLAPPLVTDEERALEVGEADEPEELLSAEQIAERLGAAFYEPFAPLRAFQCGAPSPLDALRWRLERAREADETESECISTCRTHYDQLAELVRLSNASLDASYVERLERTCGKLPEALAYALVCDTQSVTPVEACDRMLQVALRCLAFPSLTVDNAYAVRALRCGLQLAAQLVTFRITSRTGESTWSCTTERRAKLQKAMLDLLAVNQTQCSCILSSPLLAHVLVALRATFDYASVAEFCSTQDNGTPSCYAELLGTLQRSVELGFVRLNGSLKSALQRTLERVHLADLLVQANALIDDALSAQSRVDETVDHHVAGLYIRLTELLSALHSRLASVSNTGEFEQDATELLADLSAASFPDRLRLVLCAFESDDVETQGSLRRAATWTNVALDDAADDLVRRRFAYLDLLLATRRFLVTLGASQRGALLLLAHNDALNALVRALRGWLAADACVDAPEASDDVDVADLTRRIRIETVFALWTHLTVLRCVDELFVVLRERKLPPADQSKATESKQLEALDAAVADATLARLDGVLRTRLAPCAAKVLAAGVHLAAPLALAEPFASALRPLRVNFKALERAVKNCEYRTTQIDRELGRLRAAESKQQRDAPDGAAKPLDAVRSERERVERELEANRLQATSLTSQLNSVRLALATVQQTAARSRALACATRALLATARHAERTAHMRAFYPRLAFVADTPVSKRLVELADWLAALRSCPLLSSPQPAVEQVDASVRWCIERLKRAYDDLPDAPKSVIVALRVLCETLFDDSDNDNHADFDYQCASQCEQCSSAPAARRKCVFVQLLLHDAASVLQLVVARLADVAFRRRAALSLAAPHGAAYVQLRSRLAAARTVVLLSIRVLFGTLRHCTARTLRAHRALVGTLISAYATFCLPVASTGDDWHVTPSACDSLLARLAADHTVPLASSRCPIPAESRRIQYFILRTLALFVRVDDLQDQDVAVKCEPEVCDEIDSDLNALTHSGDEFDALLDVLLGETEFDFQVNAEVSPSAWLPRTYLAALHVLSDLLPTGSDAQAHRVRATWAERLVARRDALRRAFDRSGCLFAYRDGTAHFRRLVHRLASCSPSVALLLVDVAIESANEAFRFVLNDEADESAKPVGDDSSSTLTLAVRWASLAGRLETVYNVLLQPAARHACLELPAVSASAARQLHALLGRVARLLESDAANANSNVTAVDGCSPSDPSLRSQVLFAQLHALSALYVLLDASLEHTEPLMPLRAVAAAANTEQLCETLWLDWFVTRFLRPSNFVDAMLTHVAAEDNEFVTVAACVNLLKSLHRASSTGARLVRDALQRELTERAEGEHGHTHNANKSRRTLFALFCRVNSTFSKENVACLHALSNALEFLHVLRVGPSPTGSTARAQGLSVAEICALLNWNVSTGSACASNEAHPIVDLHTLLREYAAEEPILGDLLHSLASLLELLNRCPANVVMAAEHATDSGELCDLKVDMEPPPPTSCLSDVFQRLFEPALVQDSQNEANFAAQSRAYRIARAFEVERRIGQRNGLDDELIECAADAYRSAFRERRVAELPFVDEVLASVDEELASEADSTQFTYRNVARSVVQREFAVVNVTRFEKVGAAPWRGRVSRNVTIASQGGAPVRLARVPNSSRAASIHVDEYVTDGAPGGPHAQPDDDEMASIAPRGGAPPRGGLAQRGAFRTARGGLQGSRFPPPGQQQPQHQQSNVSATAGSATPTNCVGPPAAQPPVAEPQFALPLADSPASYANMTVNSQMFEGTPLLSGNMPQPAPNFRPAPPNPFGNAGQPPFPGAFGPSAVELPYGFGNAAAAGHSAFYARSPTPANAVARFGNVMVPEMGAPNVNAVMMQQQAQHNSNFALSAASFVDQQNAPYANAFPAGAYQPLPPPNFTGAAANQPPMRGGPSGRHGGMPQRQLRSLID